MDAIIRNATLQRALRLRHLACGWTLSIGIGAFMPLAPSTAYSTPPGKTEQRAEEHVPRGFRRPPLRLWGDVESQLSTEDTKQVPTTPHNADIEDTAEIADTEPAADRPAEHADLESSSKGSSSDVSNSDASNSDASNSEGGDSEDSSSDSDSERPNLEVPAERANAEEVGESLPGASPKTSPAAARARIVAVLGLKWTNGKTAGSASVAESSTTASSDQEPSSGVQAFVASDSIEQDVTTQPSQATESANGLAVIPPLREPPPSATALQPLQETVTLETVEQEQRVAQLRLPPAVVQSFPPGAVADMGDAEANEAQVEKIPSEVGRFDHGVSQIPTMHDQAPKSVADATPRRQPITVRLTDEPDERSLEVDVRGNSPWKTAVDEVATRVVGRPHGSAPRPRPVVTPVKETHPQQTTEPALVLTRLPSTQSTTPNIVEVTPVAPSIEFVKPGSATARPSTSALRDDEDLTIASSSPAELANPSSRSTPPIVAKVPPQIEHVTPQEEDDGRTRPSVVAIESVPPAAVVKASDSEPKSTIVIKSAEVQRINEPEWTSRGQLLIPMPLMSSSDPLAIATPKFPTLTAITPARSTTASVTESSSDEHAGDNDSLTSQDASSNSIDAAPPKSSEEKYASEISSAPSTASSRRPAEIPSIAPPPAAARSPMPPPASTSKIPAPAATPALPMPVSNPVSPVPASDPVSTRASTSSAQQSARTSVAADPPTTSATESEANIPVLELATTQSEPAQQKTIEQVDLVMEAKPRKTSKPAKSSQAAPARVPVANTPVASEPLASTRVAPKQQAPEKARPSATAMVAHHTLELELRESHVLRLGSDVHRVEVMDESICGVVQFASNEATIIGKSEGSTHVRMWLKDQGDASSTNYLIVVKARRDADDVALQYAKLRESIGQMYPKSKVDIVEQGGKLFVRGTVSSDEEAVQVISLVRRVRLIPVVDQLKVRR